MRVKVVSTPKEIGEFLRFRQQLYKNDPSYVSTIEFLVKPFLLQKNSFTKQCFIKPLMVLQKERIVAQCILIYHTGLPVLQLGFFEALENQEEAVGKLLKNAAETAKEFSLKRVVIGLNGHISYGVGILAKGFKYKNSFDSIYNKNYYTSYFERFPKQTLSTYKGKVATISKLLEDKKISYHVRHSDLSNFEKEMEYMRKLCNETIGKTHLYYPVQKGHFSELMKGIKPFLRGENLIFCGQENDPKGFLLWHPDFNQTLRAGKQHSILSIGFNLLFKRKRIDTVKLNAIGVNEKGKSTYTLLLAFKKLIKTNYRYIETNFVWDNNKNSTLLNRHFFGEPHRKYNVYFWEL